MKLKRTLIALSVGLTSVASFADDFTLNRGEVVYQECPQVATLQLLKDEPSRQCVYFKTTVSDDKPYIKALTTTTMSDADTFNFRIYGANCKDKTLGYGDRVDLTKGQIEKEKAQESQMLVVNKTKATFKNHDIKPGTREEVIYKQLCGSAK